MGKAITNIRATRGHGRPAAAAVARVPDGGRREAPVWRQNRPRPQVAPDLFGEEEFALLTRWSSASALRHREGVSAARTRARNARGKHAPGAEEDGGERRPNTFADAEQLGLSFWRQQARPRHTYSASSTSDAATTSGITCVPPMPPDRATNFSCYFFM